MVWDVWDVNVVFLSAEPVNKLQFTNAFILSWWLMCCHLVDTTFELSIIKS